MYILISFINVHTQVNCKDFLKSLFYLLSLIRNNDSNKSWIFPQTQKEHEYNQKKQISYIYQNYSSSHFLASINKIQIL